MGVEPTTLGLLDPRSNQLSYEDVVTKGVLLKIMITIILKYIRHSECSLDVGLLLQTQ